MFLLPLLSQFKSIRLEQAKLDQVVELFEVANIASLFVWFGWIVIR